MSTPEPPRDETAPAPVDPETERRQLMGAFRSHLSWLASQGVGWVPGGATPRRRPAATPDPAPVAPADSAPDRAAAPVVATASTLPAVLVDPPLGAKGLTAIREELGDCQRCRLASGRVQLVFGQGNPEADLMFIGEAPGRDEDLAGEAFVGAAGGLLTKMIAAMGLSREQVFIGNIIKCRPPRNRDPEPDEVQVCAPFVMAQIRAVQPEVIVTLGRHAAQTLLDSDAAVGRLRGRFHTLEVGERRIPLMPTYHPAYLLRNAEAKRPVWEDLKQVIRLLQDKGIL